MVRIGDNRYFSLDCQHYAGIHARDPGSLAGEDTGQAEAARANLRVAAVACRTAGADSRTGRRIAAQRIPTAHTGQLATMDTQKY